jgi:ribosomal 50S subunit-recycling heat shock protein
LRLDVFLKTSRLVKRRTVAKEACDYGRVRLNDRPAKAGAEVRPGDTITLDYGYRLLTVTVVEVPSGPVRRNDASSLYRVVSDVHRDASVFPDG